jgi:hypothetical protein
MVPAESKLHLTEAWIQSAEIGYNLVLVGRQSLRSIALDQEVQHLNLGWKRNGAAAQRARHVL